MVSLVLLQRWRLYIDANFFVFRAASFEGAVGWNPANLVELGLDDRLGSRRSFSLFKEGVDLLGLPSIGLLGQFLGPTSRLMLVFTSWHSRPHLSLDAVDFADPLLGIDVFFFARPLSAVGGNPANFGGIWSWGRTDPSLLMGKLLDELNFMRVYLLW